MLKPEIKKALTARNINLWLAHYKIKNEQGVQLDFHDHLFQFDIFSDFSEKQVIYKPAQVGYSTITTLKTLWLAKHRGMDIIYTLPTANDVKDFVGGKVNRIIAQNPVLQSYVKEKDTIEQKSVGDNIIYYRGTWTQKAAMMVTSDLNVYDEVDSSKQDVIEQYSTRLQHSDKGWEWYFSHPSVPNNGVAKYWGQSDQKHWHITCSRCSTTQYMDWPDSFCLERVAFICKKCKKPLREEDRRVGKWVAKYEDKPFSGYWITSLFCPWITADKIKFEYENKTPEQFNNKILGIPYVGSDNTVKKQDILQNLTSTLNSQDRVVIGSDSGLKKHFVVGNGEGLFYYGVTENWQDIEVLLRKYQQSILVVDHLPDITGPRKLQELYPGRVFLAHYSEDRKGQQLVSWGTKKQEGSVRADRNRTIQLLIDEFKDRRIPLQGNQTDWNDYIEHWQSIYKLTQENDYGIPKSKWLCSASKHNADWVHATVYWRIGMERMGQQGAELLTPRSEHIPYHRGIELEPDGTFRNNIIKNKQFAKFEY